MKMKVSLGSIRLLVALGFLLMPFAARALSTGQHPVADSAEQICPRLVGTQIPALQLRLADGSEVLLDSLWAKKPTVLVFFRGGW